MLRRARTLAVASAILASSIACGRAETFGLDPASLDGSAIVGDGAIISGDSGEDPGPADVGPFLPDVGDCLTPSCLDGSITSDGSIDVDGGAFDGSVGPDASALDGSTPPGDGGLPPGDGGLPPGDGGARDSGTPT
ncbi:hypothetical protein L6R52_03175, partial [Myxococcota bacterium]|nr:hypothetical protein [Myxococcota bacterium]